MSEIKTAIDNLTKESVDFAKNEAGEWIEVARRAPKDFRDRVEMVKTKRGRNVQRRAQELNTRGEMARDRAIEAKARGIADLPETAAIHMGQLGSKVGAGLKDIAGFALPLMAKGAGSGVVMPEISRQKMERDKSMLRQEELMREFNEETPLGQALGETPMYVASGTMLNPATKKLAGKALDYVTGSVQGASRAGRGTLYKGTKKLSEQEGPAGTLGAKMKREWADPKVRKAMRKKNQETEVDPYRKDLLNRIIQGGSIGAIEDTSTWGRNPIEGAIGGTLGMLPGELLKPRVSRAPVYWDENEQRLVDWAQDKGMKFLPGMETGSRRLQKFEHGLRESGDFGDYMGQVDRGNQKIFNKVAWEAAGIPRSQTSTITPEFLRKHKDNLSYEYQALQDASTGRFTKESFDNVNEVVEGLNKIETPESKRALTAINGYADRIAELANVKRTEAGLFQAPTRDPMTGKMRKATFGGKDFQDLRTKMKQDMSSAYDNNHRQTAEALKVMVNELDKAMELGVKDFGGEATAAQWKDLNERYAMTSLILDKGTNLGVKFDARKLGNYLMETDAERTLLEKGGRIQDLQKLAKVDFMMREQAGSGLSGTNMEGIKNTGKQTLAQGLLQHPVAGRVPLLPSLYMKAYTGDNMFGIQPAVKGLLGMSGEGMGDISRYTRAGEMATDLHTAPMAAAAEFGSDAMNYVENIDDKTRAWLEEQEQKKLDLMRQMGLGQ